MINRVLIRIKVVQLLYSYLLVENKFTLCDSPENPTREKRFAYNLYLDVLGLMEKIASGINHRGLGYVLKDTRFIQRISIDERIKSQEKKMAEDSKSLYSALPELISKIKESGLYKKYLKSENPGSLENEKIWQDIFNQIIFNDSQLNKLIADRDGFTLNGVDRMREMMETTFSNFYSSSDNIHDALNTLKRSMDKARELYFRLLQLPILLTSIKDEEIENNRTKFLATSEDRNPNLRFVENAFVETLRNSEELEKGIAAYGTQFGIDDGPVLRSLLKAITASEYYQEYMAFPATDFKMDCELWKNLYKYVIFENPDFLEALEDKSVFWNDDLGIIGDFVLKTVRNIAESHKDGNNLNTSSIATSSFLLPMYKDEEDSRFGKELFELVIKNKETYKEYIDEALDKTSWESDRLAYMDIVIMMTALAEILNFPKIPLNVSLNEYIEIAKSYSTPKRGQFISALLGDIFSKLREVGK